jgi:hypothetical protein
MSNIRHFARMDNIVADMLQYIYLQATCHVQFPQPCLHLAEVLGTASVLLILPADRVNSHLPPQQPDTSDGTGTSRAMS